MLEDTIKICEDVARTSKPAVTLSRMPFGMRSTARVAFDQMKKSTQIQSGPSTFTSQAPTCRSHRDLPDGACPIHKKAKHTLCECRALKKLHRPTSQVATQGRQIHQALQSLNCGVFQVTQVILTPNTGGSEVAARHGLPDRESFVVFADVPL